MMSNALYPMRLGPAPAAAAGAQTAPIQCAGFHPALVALVAVGICVLVVWIVRRIAHPEKASLRNTPGRPNVVNLVHVVLVLAAMWLVSAAAGAVLEKTLFRHLADEAAGKAADARLIVAIGMAGSVAWLAGGLIVAAIAFRHGLARGLGLSARRWLYDTSRAVLAYLAVLPICVGLNLAMLSLFRMLGIQPRFHPVLEGMASFSIEWKVLSVCSTVVLAPLTEEIFFRGLLQSMIRRYLRSPWAAVVGASVVFSAFHVAQPQAVPSLFALSVALGYNYERTGRLYAPILIHALFNAVWLWLAQ
jgi:membrane protease YdiL (CAAX protease family)